MSIDSGSASADLIREREQIERENARVGYQVASSLIAYEGTMVWARYGAMLIVHTIIFAAVGLASNASRPVSAVVWVGLSVVGLVLCLLWWTLHQSGFLYFYYWVFSARELEERYLEPIQTLSRGTPSLDVPLALDRRTVHLPVGRTDRIARVSKLTIIVFALVYASLPIVSLLALVGALR